ncbi:SRPBCC family protein [Rubrivirga marina]|uniref:Polyketide cyclase n=1 Tax=Rubrivirga marina TaxID=1196024 RepID=A0A271IXL2_9BACT|nr:SRPBCC family protein [Rubrivirga marina]PAP75986.1 hypothetical protein BSZ37_05785 [Rubrivirga marina]
MRVEHALRIAAPPDVVWAVTEDVERWPELTPTITSVTRVDDGPLRLGSQARIKQPAQPEAVWTVTEFVDGERFAWETRRPGLRMTGSHRVSLSGNGTTNHLGVEASGVLAVLLGPFLRPVMHRALVQENEGMKARCEAIARERAQAPSLP